MSKIARYTKPYQPKTRLESDEHTLAHYNFQEGTGDTLKDSSGNGHHGKIIGAKWVKTTSPTTSSPPPAIAPFDAAAAKAHQKAWADYLGLPVEKEVELPGGEKMVFMLIPPGEFLMGSSEDERAKFLAETETDPNPAFYDRILTEGPQHSTRITQPFYLGKFEVTQAQWQTVMGNNPSKDQREPAKPVEQVSWDDVQRFLAKLREETSTARHKFMLPTEAQWEFACRAGTTTPWHSGNSEDELQRVAWVVTNSKGMVHQVGQLASNGFGLHDMHGNVFEWCSDWHAENSYTDAPVEDPKGVETGLERVCRGGTRWGSLSAARSAYRGKKPPSTAWDFVGFRLAMTIDVTKLETSQIPPAELHGSGDILKDSSGNGYDGKIIGAKWVPVADDNHTRQVQAAAQSEQLGMIFDSPETYAVVDELGIDFSEPFTCEMWTRPFVVQEDQPQFSRQAFRFGPVSFVNHHGPKHHGPRWQMIIGNNLPKTSNADIKVAYVGQKSLVETKTQRQHVALQWTGEYFTLYVDGENQKFGFLTGGRASHTVPEMMNAFLDANTSSKLEISRASSFVPHPLHGVIEQFRVSKGVKYQSKFTPRHLVPDQSTVALYDFNRENGDVLKDSSGNGHDGKIVGAKWVSIDGPSGSDRVTRSTGAASTVPLTASPSLVELLTSANSDWTRPENLGPTINTPRDELRPTLTVDQLNLYFARDGKLLVATRDRREDPFGEATEVTGKGISSESAAGPFLFDRDLRLAYAVRRDGHDRIMMTSRPATDQPFETVVDTEIYGHLPTLTADGLIMVYRSDYLPRRLLMTERPSLDSAFGKPVELFPSGGTEPFLSADGLTLIFGRANTNYMFVTSRKSREESFGVPVNVGKPFTEGAFNGAPWISREHDAIYFLSRRPGGIGDHDIYVSTRDIQTPEAVAD